MHIPRKIIPDNIKRILRQESGFGCCKCGRSIIEYHHIIPRSENPEDMMVLCPICHQEVTSGAMDESEQRYYKRNPINIKKGYVTGTLKVNQKFPIVTLGNNQFVGKGNILWIDNECLFSINIDNTICYDKSSILTLTIDLYDEQDSLLLSIKNNEWISGDSIPWDIESSFQKIKIRHKLRDIALEINAKKFPIEIRGSLWRKGQNYIIGPNDIIVNGVVENAGISNVCIVAGRLIINTKIKNLSISSDPDFGQCIIKVGKLLDRIREGKIAYAELLNKIK